MSCSRKQLSAYGIHCQPASLSDMQCSPAQSLSNIAHPHILSQILSSSDILPTGDQGDSVSLVVYIVTDGPDEGRTSANALRFGDRSYHEWRTTFGRRVFPTNELATG